MTDYAVRVIAVDWSGDQSGGAKQIWLAEAQNGRVIELRPGRTRTQLVDYLIAEGLKTPNMVAGFDFAFSLPAWFVEGQGAHDGPGFWDVVAMKGEDWLRDCPWPFYGKNRTPMPSNVELFRRTEREIKEAGGPSPSSVFLLAGSKQVGPGSIRGMPQLARLRRAGWHIWPFDPPKLPLVVEIFPRLFMGPVVKTDPIACTEFLETRFPDLDRYLATIAAANDDAFDATVSALLMAEHVDVLQNLSTPINAIDALEGRIWSG
jgi:hypothetical protein